MTPFLSFPPCLDYGSNSSLHGVGYLLDPQSRPGHRLLWLLVFITSLALAISLTHQSYVHWQDNQVGQHQSEGLQV